MRNKVLDILKGFAIFLVVIGHLIQKSNIDYDHDFLWRFIYSFHMPLFFFISGFLAFLTKNEGVDLIVKRFNSLMIPFFFWAIVYYFAKGNNELSLLNYLKDVVLTPDIGLWFLWVLFFCYLLLVFAKKIPFNTYYSFILISVLLLIYSVAVKNKNFGINLISKQFPFFLLGYLTNNFREYVFNIIKKYRVAILVIFVISASFWMRKDDPLFYKYINLGSLFKLGYIFFVGVLGVFTCFSLFMDIKEDTTNKIYLFLSFIGKYTLAIYAVHFLILDLITIRYHVGIIYYLSLIGFSFTTMILCVIIDYLISLFSIPSRLLLGKYNLSK